MSARTWKWFVFRVTGFDYPKVMAMRANNGSVHMIMIERRQYESDATAKRSTNAVLEA